jgi:sigma-B regulation protein RsbU (phosphoserine phosphatase)
VDTERLRRLASQIREKEDTDRSLKIASLRQKRMLPNPPELENYDFGFTYEPAAHVSGDFYDFIPVRENVWGIVVADVSGHGVEAGIIMGMAKQAVKIFGRQNEDPTEVLSLANEELHRSLDGKTFVSLSYAVLNTETSILRFARAGQCKPIMANPSWKAMEPCVVESKGLALGVDKGPRFRQIIEPIDFKLEPGDLFFQYTDGLAEAMNAVKEQFGDERIMSLLKRYGRSPAQELVEIVMEALKDFTRGAEQEDDITLLALKYREPQPTTRVARFDFDLGDVPAPSVPAGGTQATPLPASATPKPPTPVPPPRKTPPPPPPPPVPRKPPPPDDRPDVSDLPNWMK